MALSSTVLPHTTCTTDGDLNVRSRDSLSKATLCINPSGINNFVHLNYFQ